MTDTTDQQAVTVAQEDHTAAINFLDQCDGQDWSLDWLVANAIAHTRLASVSSASAETLALQAIKAVTATAKDGAAGLSRIMAIANAAGVQASYSELLQDPAVALIVDRPRTEWAHLFKPDATGCAIPPEGWQCSRARGHTGPCAATPEPVPATNQAGEVERVADAIEHEYDYGGAHQELIEQIEMGGGYKFKRAAMRALARAALAALATQPATSQEGEADKGTFACPICGKDTPHYHSPEEVTEHRETEAWVEESWQQARSLFFPATSQEGEAIDRVAKAIYEAGGSFADQNGIIACADLDGSNDAENFRKMARAALAASPTPPTLSEDLREAVGEAIIWHESEDKALSKQPPSADGRWRRMQHQEQIATLRAALAQVKAS